jgi:Smr domain
LDNWNTDKDDDGNNNNNNNKNGETELDAVTATLLIRGLNHWKEAEVLASQFPGNPYVYSAAISVCGRRFDIALNLYDQYERGRRSTTTTTAVANAVLKTCAGRNRAVERLAAALKVVDGLSSHDTITWNSLLAVVVATRRFLTPQDWQSLEQDFSHWFGLDSDSSLSSSSLPSSSHNERLVMSILSQPQATFNAVTYKHAVQAIGVQGITRLLTDFIPPELRTLDLYNQALAVVGTDVDQLFRLLSMMQHTDGITAGGGDDDTKIYIIQALGSAPESQMDVSSIVLGTANDDSTLWAVQKAASYGINLHDWLSDLGQRHWAVAVEACMRAGDDAGSKRLLQETNLDELVVDDSDAAERIATAYAHIALTSDPSQAANAYKIVSSLRQPSMKVLEQGTRACFRAGMWNETRVLLKRVHRYVLERPGERVTRGNTLGCLHRELLKGCSRQGNLTVALTLCKDIQSISRQLAASNATTTNVGMGAMEWKYFIATAAKSGNWKICLSTLQHLRAPLIAANPAVQSKTPETLRGHYAKLESVLNHAVRCFATNKQFAWILRVIDDWIDWSGRPPPLAAARAAVRCFAAEQKMSELNTLLAKIMAMETTAYNMDRELYRERLYVSAVTSLYNNGLYEYADDQFVTAVAQGAIQFQVAVDSCLPTKKSITLDLHGMNLAMAHSAVSIALQREASYHNDALAKPIELMIITGKGVNSKLKLRPILRPAVQQMLVEEFYPPLATTTSPGNTGVLVIPPGEISSWLDYQCQQRGVRMLLVAAMLKNLAVKVVSRISDISGGVD